MIAARAMRASERIRRAPARRPADTVSLRPGESAEIITRFGGHLGRPLFHCHRAEHEDMGMMSDLRVV
ncbi:multicopper oxidase domain-containing protein [Streptomyces carpinensis]|uniref:Multicopper oxidase domain-containing protein n=1 Tax=Streptomyces carpinensis TaxID=66369 RepID=A0ABV1WBA5_9ACTN|nr:multicopper oxidase domain-containing protein [Streptomyces carpinensis]